MTKLYIYAAIFFSTLAFIYWYSDNQYDAGVAHTTGIYEKKLKEALEAGIEKSNKQASSDAIILTNNINKLNTLRNKYDDLKIKASNTTICKPDFIELYNDSIRAANQK